jgi:hypothetical protein
MRRAHDPSRFRGRRLRRGRHPQQQCGDAGGLRRQVKFAAGDEIELPRLAPDFQHHGAERIAGQRVGGGAQRGIGVGGTHGHQPARIETEFAKPAHRQRAGFPFGKILPHPDQRPARRQPSGKARDEAGSRRTLMSLGEHLMHRGQSETALQRCVSVGVAKRGLAMRMRITGCFDALDAAAQTRKRAGACGAHAPLLQEFRLQRFFRMNPRPAHLFMICSNIKLTGYEESIGIGVELIHEQNQRDLMRILSSGA